MPEKLSARQVNDFKESAVWQEFVKRLQAEQKKALNKVACSQPDAFESGRYKALEMVLEMPDILLQELEPKSKLPWR